MQIIDGRKIKKEILEKVKKEIASFSFQPVFCDVLVGSDPASIQYVKMKAKTAESVGIKFQDVSLSESISTEDLILEIKKLNEIENMCGIIVQLPLPAHLNKQKVLDAVDEHLDVDCLGSITSEKFYKACLRRQGDFNLGFPTALACIYILDSLNLSFENKNIVVLGQGDLVGKPVTALLRFRNLNVETITRITPDKEVLIKNADIIISGMGNGQYVKGNMIKEGVVIIDAGTSESTGSIVGDIDLESVKNIASYISPVPGGVGPVTVAMLLNNILLVAKNKNNDK